VLAAFYQVSLLVSPLTFTGRLASHFRARTHRVTRQYEQAHKKENPHYDIFKIRESPLACRSGSLTWTASVRRMIAARVTAMSTGYLILLLEPVAASPEVPNTADE
jgi:hypothetical protein